MATEENTYFLRSFLLLVEGGLYISRETLGRECQKAGGNLDALLKQCENKLKHEFHGKQYDKLFPQYATTDINKWDLQLSVGVLINVFGRSLSLTEKQKLRALRDLRNEIYMHCASASLDQKKYGEVQEELEDIITTLAATFDKPVRDRCSAYITQFATGPLDGVTPSLATLNGFSQTCQKKLKVGLHTELVVGGPSDYWINLCEHTLDTILNNAESMASEGAGFEEIEKNVKKMLEFLLANKNVVFKGSKKACIILMFECNSYDDVLLLLQKLDSQEFRDHLRRISVALLRHYQFDATISISTSVRTECLQSILIDILKMYRPEEIAHKHLEISSENETDDKDDHVKLMRGSEEQASQKAESKRPLKLDLECTSRNGLLHFLNSFKKQDFSNHLKSVADALSNHFGKNITLKASLDIDDVMAAIEEAVSRDRTRCMTLHHDSDLHEDESEFDSFSDQTGKGAAKNEDCDDEDDSSSSLDYCDSNSPLDSDYDTLDSDYENHEAETEAISTQIAAPLKLRKYQLELAKNAVLGRNTIICAETGSGKTWVALHIIQKHLQQAGKGPRKAVFMARTGALIKQQSDRFKAYLPELQTKLITGDDGESRMLNMFAEHYDILCFTPQILVNNLEDNVIKSLSEFSLLILDECHHTIGDGPYSTLMRKYLLEKAQTRNEMPQVVGLTASIGVGKSRTDMEAFEYILRVCACLDVRIISTVERNLPELKKHINMPDEETIQLVEQRDDPCKHVIMTAMKDIENRLRDISFMRPDIFDLMDKQPRNRESQQYNNWTVDVMKAALLKVDNVSRDISSCAKYLNIYNSALEVNKLLPAKDVIKYLAEKHKQDAEKKSKLTGMERTLYSILKDIQKTMDVKGKGTENPNVRILSDTLRKMLEEKGDESRAVVFVKARATCMSLANFLDNDLKNSGVCASPLYGKENRGGDDGMTKSQQTEILEKFREGFYKVLVCTSVGNEGIDIPDCNIVLSYEYSGDEITKIQMKGRARKKKATTITMGSDKVVEQERINAYKASMMYRALKRVKELDPKYFDMIVTAFQKEVTHKYRFKAEVEKLEKGRKSDEDCEILCGRCNTFACYVSDVRQLGHDHIVIDKAFADKITRKEHKKPKTYDGLHKKYKMFCKKCPLDWGIIGIRDGLDCMILKITNFKFRNLRTHGVSTYKKWIDMPYNIPEVRLEDLPRLLGTQEEKL